MSIKNNYNHTLYASYIGFITQAILNNFAPLLFLTFQTAYRIPLDKITLLATVNFAVALVIDLVSAKFADKIGYRPLIVIAHALAAAGLMGLAVFPRLFGDPYTGLLIAVVIYAIGGGITEVLISPIIEACPTERKSAVMSLSHSFYCWGCVFVILGSTLFFVAFSIENWAVLAVIWAIVPLLNALYFSRVPIYMQKTEGMQIKKLLSLKVFWLFAVLMLCAAAAELSMAQWASAFAESGLRVNKTVGDLAGPCMFAAFMGVARVLYSKYSAKINLRAFMICSGCLSVVSYLLASLASYPALALAGCGLCGLSAGILWPGMLSFASARCPGGGTALFALLAFAGALGCSAGPTVVGMVSSAAGDDIKTGLLAAAVFPFVFVLGLALYVKPPAK